MNLTTAKTTPGEPNSVAVSVETVKLTFDKSKNYC